MGLLLFNPNDDFRLFSWDRHDIYTFEIEMNESLARINAWMMVNMLCIYTGKTKPILFNSPRTGSVNLRMRVSANAIDLVDSLLRLEVIVDRKLDFDVHWGSISAKICLTLRKLYAHVLLMSYVNYCTEVIFGPKLIIKCITRFVYNARLRKRSKVSGRATHLFVYSLIL